MSFPAVVGALVKRFADNRDTYRSPAYKEAQLRVEFLNPLFEALGWDVANRQGYAEPYKEVISEDTLRIAGDSKAPDYAFRIGGARKFFVEAKKPSVSLENDPSPAYQLRRYAWSAKLPLSILTSGDRPAGLRTARWRCRDYLRQWLAAEDSDWIPRAAPVTGDP